MAIDPSISLGIRPVEPVDITKLQQIRNLAAQEEATRQSILSNQAQEALLREQLRGTVPLQQELLRQQIPQTQAATALTQAQIPGVRAESEIRAQAAAANKWFRENTLKYADENGVVDRIRLGNAAQVAGFPKEADAITASHIANMISLGNVNKAINDSITYVANGLDKLPPPQRASYLQSKADYMEKQIPGSGQQMLKLLGNVDPKTNIVVPDMNRVGAVIKSAITPLEAEQLKNTRDQIAIAVEQLNQSGVMNVTGPAARNPNSDISKLYRAAAAEVGVPGLTENSTAADLNRVPGVTDRVQANVIGRDVKNLATTTAINLNNQTVDYQNVAKYAENLKNRKLIDANTTILGSWLQAQIGTKVEQDPDYLAIRSLMTKITANNPNFNINQPTDAIIKQANSFAEELKQKAAPYEQLAPLTTFKEVPKPATKSLAETAAPAAPKLNLKPGAIYKGELVVSPEQEKKLKPGTIYRDTDGVRRIKE